MVGEVQGLEVLDMVLYDGNEKAQTLLSTIQLSKFTLHTYTTFYVNDLELLRVALKDALYGEGEVDLLESNIHQGRNTISS